MPGTKSKRRKPKPIILPAIIAELERQGVTRLKLSKLQRGAHATTCQAYLYSGRDARVSTVEAMMRKLGLVVVSANELSSLRASKAREERRAILEARQGKAVYRKRRKAGYEL